MIAPRRNWMMGVPPTSASGNSAANGDVELFWSEVAEKVGVEFADGRSVTDPETAVDDLDSQFAIRGRSAVRNSPNVFQILDEPL
jgi:hypothetical protein